MSLNESLRNNRRLTVRIGKKYQEKKNPQSLFIAQSGLKANSEIHMLLANTSFVTRSESVFEVDKDRSNKNFNKKLTKISLQSVSSTDIMSGAGYTSRIQS